MSKQPSLFDDSDPADEAHAVAPPSIQHSPTSQAAANAIAPVAGRLRRAVYECLREAGEKGCTDEELQTALAMPASTERPRRVELVAAGAVKDSGKTRKTRSGRSAVVWVVASMKLAEEAA